MTTLLTGIGDDCLAHEVEITPSGKSLHLQSRYHADLVKEIKWMDRARWNGRVWSLPNTPRTRYTLRMMSDDDGVQRYLDDPVRGLYTPLRPNLRGKQEEMLDWIVQKRQCGLAAAPRTGKSLVYMETIESNPNLLWWLVAPKRVLAAVQVEMRKWDFKAPCRLLSDHQFRSHFTYPTAKRAMWKGGPVPQGVIYDEISLFKGPTSKKTLAGIELAGVMNEAHGEDGCFRFGGTGTPQPKNYLDWWAITEILQPGFLPWGNVHKLEEYLAVRTLETAYVGGHQFWKRVQWKDGSPCITCAGTGEIQHSKLEDFCWPCKLCLGTGAQSDHLSPFMDRIKDFWIVIRKEDVIELGDLPPIEAVPIFLEPSRKLLSVAAAVAASGLSAIEVRSAHRQLSDGFRYVQEDRLDTQGQPMLDKRGDPLKRQRTIRGKSNPKMVQYLTLLDDHVETGRFVVTAAYKAANTWLCEESEKHGWRVIRCDSQTDGFRALWDDSLTEVDCLELFGDREEAQSASKPIVIVGHPKSLGYGTDLAASCGFCAFSSDDNGETFMQMIQRGHSSGMDRELGCTVYFLLNLPTDELGLRSLLMKKRDQDVSVAEIRGLYEGTPPRISQTELQGLLEMFYAEAGPVHKE